MAYDISKLEYQPEIADGRFESLRQKEAQERLTAPIDFPFDVFSSKGIRSRWMACMSPDESKVFVMYSNQRCTWVYKYTFNSEGKLDLTIEKPFLVK